MTLMRQAGSTVTNEEFVLRCQTKVDLESGEIIGAQALVCWRHPLLGLQSPELFIRASEGICLMTVPQVIRLKGRDPLLSELSLAGHKVLGLLQKGPGYHVLGVWRFRGSRSPCQRANDRLLTGEGFRGTYRNRSARRTSNYPPRTLRQSKKPMP